MPRIYIASALLLVLGNHLVLATAADVIAAPVRSDDLISLHPKVVVWWGGGQVTKSLLDRFAEAAGSSKIAAVVGDEGLGSEIVEWSQTSNRPFEVFSSTAPDVKAKLREFDAVWVDTIGLTQDAEIVENVLISNKFLTEEPVDTLVAKLESRPGFIGIGVPPGTALFAMKRRLEIVGESEVVFCLPASLTRSTQRPTAFLKNKPGTEADLIALCRASIARRGPAFPPDRNNPPVVPHGTLLACGGGELPDVVWQRFIDLAGGIDAPIVVIPTAMPNPDSLNPKGLDRLQKLGCQRLKVLNQHTKADVQSHEFIEALKEARGVWFAGGRQWKYVDAYEGPTTELFRDVLKRNGVIAGTSAGAAIQAEYMVRGNPLGNREIMAEGYERGMNFLPGCAIDIHVTERGRLKDLIGLIQTYPQLLGIGVDEETAAEIQGSVLTVIGDRKVTIVDSHNAEPTPLKSGDRLDLIARKQLP